MHLPAEFFVDLANYETIIHDTLKEVVEVLNQAFKNEFWLMGSFRLAAGHEPLTHLSNRVKISYCLTKQNYCTLPLIRKVMNYI